jgi:hypothetical protein
MTCPLVSCPGCSVLHGGQLVRAGCLHMSKLRTSYASVATRMLRPVGHIRAASAKAANTPAAASRHDR